MNAREKLRYAISNLILLARWIVYSVVIGTVIGLIGTAFGYAMQIATNARTQYSWIVLILPLLGVVIVFVYRKSGMEKNTGTNLILEAVSSNEQHVPLRVAPVIFISTVLTHLGGGSAGREGAALQLGGSLGTFLGKFFKVDDHDEKIAVMCGMSAAFAALFGTPLTAAIFPLEVVSVGMIQYSALIPCVFCAMIAAKIAVSLGLHAEAFPVEAVPQLGLETVGKLIVIAILCGLLSTLFCTVLHTGEKVFKKRFSNPYVRVIVGGVLIVVLTLLVGNQEYNGAGMQIIERCVLEGEVFFAAFLLKMLFTAITLGSGFRGGEIVPAFFVGATFGCLAGKLLGFSPTLSAACGMLGVFCGVTNSPISTVLMGLELFGSAGMQYYLLTVAISYCVSGYSGLYSSQKILYSKWKIEYINRKANH